jgi:hypothetical protein
MAKELIEFKSKKRITKLFLSDDWKSKTPWRHNNLVQPYFSKIKETSESEQVKFTYFYIGPFGIISGKWVVEKGWLE